MKKKAIEKGNNKTMVKHKIKCFSIFSGFFNILKNRKHKRSSKNVGENLIAGGAS